MDGSQRECLEAENARLGALVAELIDRLPATRAGEAALIERLHPHDFTSNVWLLLVLIAQELVASGPVAPARRELRKAEP